MKPNFRNRGLPAVLLSLVVVILPSARALDGPENWRRLFGSPEDVAEEDTGVLGMTAEEAQAYHEQEAMDVAADEETPESFIRNRRRFVMREIKINSDWDCDPTALPAMVDQFKVRTGMDAQALLPRKPLSFDSPEILDWPFVYLTAHYAFTFSEAESEGFRKFIERGGFLYADDCLYGQTFGPTFLGEVAKHFPESAMKPIDPKDPIIGLVGNQKYVFTNIHESGIPMEFMNANPWLGLQFEDRLAILYSPQDIGCAWEISAPPTPANPLGTPMHSMDLIPGLREAAYRLGVNIILYSLLH